MGIVQGAPRSAAPESGVGERAWAERAAPELLVRLGLDGSLQEANEAFCEFARARGAAWPDDGAGAPYERLARQLGEDVADATARVLDALASGASGRASLELRCFHGASLRWYQLEASRGDGAILLCHSDITERRRADELSRLQAVVSAAIAERQPLVSACRELAAAVCEGLAWDVASVWVPNDWQQLVCAALHSAPAFARGELETLTRTARLGRGEGLPGRVWERCTPVWLADLCLEPGLPRLRRASATGLRSGFAIPVHHDGQVVAVLELLGRAERTEDRSLLELLGALGRELAASEQQARARVRRAAEDVTGARLEQLIESAPGYLVAIDERRRIRFINRVSPHLRRDEVLGSDWLRFAPPAEHAALEAKLEVVLEQGVPQQHDIGVLGADGREVWLCVQIAPVREDGAITGAIISALDATALKRALLEFSASQRWISVGTLAAGVAHEINTPIQFAGDNLQFIGHAMRRLLALTSALESLLSRVEASRDEALASAGEAARRALSAARLEFLRDELPRALAACDEGLGRVSSVVRSLARYARPAGAEERQPTDLNALVQSALSLARPQYAAVAELSADYGELPLVRCNGADIGQVVLNVVLNAVEAIRVAAGGAPRRGLLGVQTWREHDHAVIAIQDSGDGIPEEIRSRVFDPFFTTKGVGQGTGEGLALAWSVVTRDHGGVISFESSVGQGTTVFIRLPIDGAARPE